MQNNQAATAEIDSMPGQAFLLTWLRTIVYMDDKGDLGHAYYSEIRDRRLKVIVAPPDLSAAPPKRYGSTPERDGTWAQSVAIALRAQGVPVAQVTCLPGGLIHLRRGDGNYFCADPNGRIAQDRVKAQQWETFSVCAWGRAADAGEAAREQRIIDARGLYHEGRSQHALAMLDQITAEGLGTLTGKPAMRIAELRAEIEIDLGRWHRLERIAGPRWDYLGNRYLAELARLRAVLDGVSPESTGVGDDPAINRDTGRSSYIAGLATLGRASDPERRRRIRRPGPPDRRVERVVTMTRHEWPYHCGAVVTAARVAGHDFVCYAPGIGALPFSDHHHQWYRRGGASAAKHTFAILRPTERIHDVAVLIGGHMNYYHNTVEYLLNYFFVVKMIGLWRTFNPRLATLLAEARLLVRASNARFHRDYLEILGVPSERIHPVADNQAIECDKLVLLPKAIQGDGYVRDIDAVVWLHDRLDGLFRSGSGPRRVYVSRSDAKQRRVVNEDGVRQLLEKHGFVTITPSNLTVLEQFQLFRDAEIIVGPHGAGLTNILATRRGSKVIELVPSRPPRLFFFRNLAWGLGHEHTFVEAQTVSEALDIQVDVASLRAALDGILAAVAR